MPRFNLARGLFGFACLSLAFALGLRIGEQYQLSALTLARHSFRTLMEEAAIRTGLRPVPFVLPARHPGADVTRLEPGRTHQGLTLLAGFFDGGNEIRLIRLDGTVVRRWPVRFSAIFPDLGHIYPIQNRPRSDWNIDIHGALALPDGSVVFNFEYAGMAKLGRCGEVAWTLPMMAHHSIEPSGDGGFWVPGRRYAADASEYLPLRPPYLEDMVWKVSADGKLLQELSVPGLIFENGLESILLANGLKPITIGEMELVHLNDIEELTEARAADFPAFTAGDLLLSLRDLNLVMVVDPVARRVKWHRTGPWIRQHDPDFRAGGTISIFNNNTDDTPNGSIFGGSNIVTIDPVDGTLSYTYGTKPDEAMFTNIRGKHQLMASGSVLIAEFEAGRAFEVDRKGDIVWEYINRYDADHVHPISQAIRYPEDYFLVDDWTCP